MKYFIDALKYNGKNLIKMAVFALIPAFFIGGLIQPYCLSNFYAQYDELVVSSYSSIFGAFFNFNWQNVIVSLLGLLLLIFIVSVIMGIIERHMRTGKFSLSESTTFLNNNFLIVFAYFALLLFLYFATMVVISLILFVMHILMSGTGNIPTTSNYILSYVVGIGLFLLFFYFATIIFLSIPETISTGYSVPNCIGNTAENLGKKARKAYFSFVVVLLIHFPIAILSFGTWWQVLANILSIFLYICYFCTVNYIIYFDANNISREDTHKFKFRFFKG